MIVIWPLFLLSLSVSQEVQDFKEKLFSCGDSRRASFVQWFTTEYS